MQPEGCVARQLATAAGCAGLGSSVAVLKTDKPTFDLVRVLVQATQQPHVPDERCEI